MVKTRNSFVELFRIFCIFGILFVHKNGFMIDVASGGQIPWIMLVNILNFESSFLMLVSAYYGNPYSSKKRIFKLWLMVLFYTYAGLVMNIAQTGLVIGDLENLVRTLFPITTGTSWFAAGYIMIWLISPFFEKMTENISQREYFVYLLIVFSFFSVIPTFTTYGPISNTGKDVGTLFTAYCIGRYLRKYGVIEKKKGSFFAYIAIGAIVSQLCINGICIFLWQNVLGKPGVFMPFSWDHSFTEFILSIALLGMVSKVSFSNNTINFISKRVFGMVLFERFAYVPFTTLIDYQKLPLGIYYFVVVAAYVFIIMVEGLIAESLRRIVFDGLENGIISILSNCYNILMKKIYKDQRC